MIAALESTLSPARLNHWQTLVANPNLAAWRSRAGIVLPANRAAAIRLHEWNATLCMAVLGSTSVFEIALRNRMHDALSNYRARDDWWDPARDHLIADDAAALDTAVLSVRRRGAALTPGRVISELTLGFWWSLTGPSYDNPRDAGRNYWRTCLSEVFRLPLEKRPDRAAVNSNIDRIRRIRNSAAHGEPIVHEDLPTIWAIIRAQTRRLCPLTAEWLEEQSLLPGLLAADWLGTFRSGARLIGSR